VVRPIRPRSIASALVAGAVAIVLLSACAQEAPQSKEHSSTEGIDATIQGIGIRNAFITINADGTGVLNVALFNDGTQADALTSVTSGNATAFKAAVLPTAEEIGEASDNNSGSSSSDGSADSDSPSDGSSASDSSANTDTAVSLPTGSGIFLDQEPAEIALQGLALNTLVGQTLPVTFTFAAAGTITLQIPIGSGSNVTATPSASDSSSDTPTDSSSATS
jgi:hypothetical protein